MVATPVRPSRTNRPSGGRYEEYHPYGSTAWYAEKSGIDVSAKRYRYTGKEKDEETGLHYHGARYYAAWLGRWTSADPIGLGDGANRYAYVHGNPVGGRDPTGLGDENPTVPRPWPPPPPPISAPDAKVAVLPPDELARRRAAVAASIETAKASAPRASEMIAHWLGGSGQQLTLTPEHLGLAREGSGFPAYLRDTVRPALGKAIQAHLSELRPGEVREIRLSASDLTPTFSKIRGEVGFRFPAIAGVGAEGVIPNDPGADLSVALGNVRVQGRAMVTGVYTDGKLTGVDVTSFQISITDAYNWNKDAEANVPVPPGTVIPLPSEAYTLVPVGVGHVALIKDTWMQEVERSGGAKSFPLVVEPFEAPETIKANFEVTGGSVGR